MANIGSLFLENDNPRQKARCERIFDAFACGERDLTMLFKPVRSGGTEPKALLITVHYKSVDSVLALVGSIEHVGSASEVATTIVDNSSGENDLSGIRRAIAQLP